MKLWILAEFGYPESMRGLSLSYNRTPVEMESRAKKLAGKGAGHDKFLSHIDVWMVIQAPIFWWNEFDQYKLRVPDIVDMNTQSESTMHTLEKSVLTQENFEYPIYQVTLDNLNLMLSLGIPIEELKNELPQGFLQKRSIKMNYMCIWNIIDQRHTHRLPQWHVLISEFKEKLQHTELLKKDEVVSKGWNLENL